MNKLVLDIIADWMLDCLISGNIAKAERLESVYNRMSNRQWEHSMKSRRRLR